VVARVGRGGGLCREIAYLPSLDRVERAFAAEPHLERWLASGRFSLDAARRLERAEGAAQANVAIIGV
ncbi:MAG: hypothetical protein FJ104_01890, partial [Deltaproteobacteria bacterium]|nr:hypothetical protein [Deltaproteobacteria bacterium]